MSQELRARTDLALKGTKSKDQRARTDDRVTRILGA